MRCCALAAMGVGGDHMERIQRFSVQAEPGRRSDPLMAFGLVEWVMAQRAPPR